MNNYPKHYEKIKSDFNSYIDAVENLGQIAKTSGPIEEKTALLIQLAAAAAVRSEGSVHSHVRRLIEVGATTDEIRHALILITCTIGFPNVIASLSWADDILLS